MPCYLIEGRRPLDRAGALAADLAALESAIRSTGGDLDRAYVLDVRDLVLAAELPDDASLARISLEAAGLGIALKSRPAHPRREAEALDRAHALRRAAAEGA